MGEEIVKGDGEMLWQGEARRETGRPGETGMEAERRVERKREAERRIESRAGKKLSGQEKRVGARRETEA